MSYAILRYNMAMLTLKHFFLPYFRITLLLKLLSRPLSHSLVDWLLFPPSFSELSFSSEPLCAFESSSSSDSSFDNYYLLPGNMAICLIHATHRLSPWHHHPYSSTCTATILPNPLSPKSPRRIWLSRSKETCVP